MRKRPFLCWFLGHDWQVVERWKHVDLCCRRCGFLDGASEGWGLFLLDRWWDFVFWLQDRLDPIKESDVDHRREIPF